jgi:hypothetical protein
MRRKLGKSSKIKWLQFDEMRHGFIRILFQQLLQGDAKRGKIIKGGKGYEKKDFIKFFSLIYFCSSHDLWSG